MALRLGLYPYFRRSHTNPSEDKIRKINLIIFGIDFNHRLISDQLFQTHVFPEEQVDLWFDYITSGIDEIYLFISNIISNKMIQSICEYPQIKFVYIFCKNQQYQNYLFEQVKLHGIFDNFDTMFKKFQDDINERKNEYYLEQNILQNLNRKTSEILWWKFVHQILPHIQYTNIAKEEFIAFAREYYRNNEDVLNQIEEFESSYMSDKAINWYTQTNFLYSFVNGIIRTQRKFTDLFKIRMILADIISGLKTTQFNSHDNTHNVLTVYRGQRMKSEDVQQLKSSVGSSVGFNQFFSTTLNRGVAQSFVQYSIDSHCRERVLFTIEIDLSDLNSGTTLFAKISNLSSYQCEEEVLFSIYSIFRVLSVQIIEANFYQIDLKLVNNPLNTDFGDKSIFNPYADEIFLGNLSKENKQCIGFQLLLDMILRLEQTIYGKKELLQFSRSKYQHDSKELQNIDDFEANYQSKDAIKWYRKYCFLYRLLNQLNHSELIDCFFKMRYFIHDLHNQLAKLQPSFIQSLNGQQNLTLYRGRTMRINQLNELRENIGGLISIKSFLTATQNKQLALAFSNADCTLNSNEVSVIYEISIDTSIQSVPYAKIPDVSNTEEDILISMGSLFRVREVYARRVRMYCIKLTMEPIDNELWDRLTGHLD